jgi:predicted nuclease of restriction endonuclease-like (RecB) superfamily
VEPLNTIYDELRTRSKYSDFLGLYDQYSTYTIASDNVNSNLGYKAYVHGHGDLPSIAYEWPTTNYQQMSILYHWSVRQLRDQEDKMTYERSLIAAKPEDEQVKVLANVTEGDITHDVILKSSYVVDFLGLKRGFSEEELEDAVVEQLEKFLMELGQDFAFLERQKKIPVDSIDYKLDLLFYHRRLHRLLAIDLKLCKFKPEYKGQMELYLKYLKKYEMQPGEEDPIGLLLCSEGNTEHIELLMLDEQNIKVAQYLTVLPEKQWFIDKMNRSIAIARELQDRKEAE